MIPLNPRVSIVVLIGSSMVIAIWLMSHSAPDANQSTPFNEPVAPSSKVLPRGTGAESLLISLLSSLPDGNPEKLDRLELESNPEQAAVVAQWRSMLRLRSKGMQLIGEGEFEQGAVAFEQEADLAGKTFGAQARLTCEAIARALASRKLTSLPDGTTKALRALSVWSYESDLQLMDEALARLDNTVEDSPYAFLEFLVAEATWRTQPEKAMERYRRVWNSSFVDGVIRAGIISHCEWRLTMLMAGKHADWRQQLRARVAELDRDADRAWAKDGYLIEEMLKSITEMDEQNPFLHADAGFKDLRRYLECQQKFRKSPTPTDWWRGSGAPEDPNASSRPGDMARLALRTAELLHDVAGARSPITATTCEAAAAAFEAAHDFPSAVRTWKKLADALKDSPASAGPAIDLRDKAIWRWHVNEAASRLNETDRQSLDELVKRLEDSNGTPDERGTLVQEAVTLTGEDNLVTHVSRLGHVQALVTARRWKNAQEELTQIGDGLEKSLPYSGISILRLALTAAVHRGLHDADGHRQAFDRLASAASRYARGSPRFDEYMDQLLHDFGPADLIAMHKTALSERDMADKHASAGEWDKAQAMASLAIDHWSKVWGTTRGDLMLLHLKHALAAAHRDQWTQAVKSATKVIELQKAMPWVDHDPNQWARCIIHVGGRPPEIQRLFAELHESINQRDPSGFDIKRLDQLGTIAREVAGPAHPLTFKGALRKVEARGRSVSREELTALFRMIPDTERLHVSDVERLMILWSDSDFDERMPVDLNALAKALSRSPTADFIKADLAVGMILAARGRFNQAAQVLELSQAVRSTQGGVSDHAAEATNAYVRSLLLRAAGRGADAAACRELAHRISGALPADHQLRLMLSASSAHHLLVASRYEEAERLLTDVCARMGPVPPFVDESPLLAHLELALVRSRLGRPKEAVAPLESALRMLDDAPSDLLHLHAPILRSLEGKVPLGDVWTRTMSRLIRKAADYATRTDNAADPKHLIGALEAGYSRRLCMLIGTLGATINEPIIQSLSRLRSSGNALMQQVESSKFLLDAVLSMSDHRRGESARVLWEQAVRWKGAVFNIEVGKGQRLVYKDESIDQALQKLIASIDRLKTAWRAASSGDRTEALKLAALTSDVQVARAEYEEFKRVYSQTNPSPNRHDARTIQARLGDENAVLLDFVDHRGWVPDPARPGALKQQHRLAVFVVNARGGGGSDRNVVDEVQIDQDIPTLLRHVMAIDRERSRQDEISLIDLGPIPELDALVEQWRSHYGQGDKGLAAAAELRRRVWLPIEMSAAFKSSGRIYVSPDGPITRLPLAALPDYGKDRYLLERYCFATLPSGWKPADRSKAPRDRQDQFLLVGDVDYGAPPPESGRAKKWFRLDGTKTEIERIDATVKGTLAITPLVIRDMDATTPRVIQAMEQARWAHLATHGFFDVQPFVFESFDKVDSGLRSGLILSGADSWQSPAPDDGQLLAIDLAQLNLHRMDLAVLSACETGLGEYRRGEGALSLQRAFQAAGVKNVVSSLWKVPDEQTQRLMNTFYDKLLEARLTPAEALRQAQLSLLQEQRQLMEESLRAGFERDEPAEQPKLNISITPFHWAAWITHGTSHESILGDN